MAALCAWIACLAMAACGGHPEGETELVSADLGTLEQPLFYYNDYGKEQGGSSARCSKPYAGGICVVPKTKTIRYHILPETDGGCYGGFWNESIRTAINGINSWNVAFQTGFEFVEVPFNLVALDIHMYIWCDADFQDHTQILGQYTPSAWSCVGAGGSDILCKVNRSWLQIAGNNMVELSQSVGASPTQFRRRIENTTRHELGHAMGLGHFPLGLGAGILMAGTATDALSDPRWNQSLAPSNYESALIWGYCPDGNTAGCQ